MSKAKINDPEFGARLQWILKEKFEGNTSEFARRIGIAITSLNRWLIGEADPSRTNLIKTAEASGVNLEWLALGIGDMDEAKPQAVKHDINLQASNDETFIEIEDCREVRLSAGGGAFNNGYEEITTTKVERAWLQSRRLKAKDCAMFLVSGESMYPTLKDSEEIIVDRSKRELTEGKIFVLNHNGSMLVKKVQFTYGGVELISDNPSYRPLKLDTEEANSLVVIGQVVRGYRDF
jgi:putative phage repressor